MEYNCYILLVVVCENGYLDIVKELIMVGVDVNVYIDDVLIMFVSKNGYLSIVQELFSYNVIVNLEDYFQLLLLVVCYDGYLILV